VSAKAYWSVNCGERTFVGSSILKMERTECKDYCKYFPHAKEVGHTFQVAGTLDDKTMECLRDSTGGAVIDPNDSNNGCLCKSEQTVAEKKVEESDCPFGWMDLGTNCLHFSHTYVIRDDAAERCKAYGAELLSWRDKNEYMNMKYYIMEWFVLHNDLSPSLWSSGNDWEFRGDWMWGDGPNFVPMDFGWMDGNPDNDNGLDRHNCAIVGKEALLYSNFCNCPWGTDHRGDCGIPACQILKNI